MTYFPDLNNSMSGYSSYGVGQQACAILESISNIYSDCNYLPITTESTKKKFTTLVATWKRETRTTHSVREMVISPSYQQIIGMGKVVLPLLLEEISEEPDHWFWALKSITGIDPVPTEHAGDVRVMTQIWLDWGRSHGFI